MLSIQGNRVQIGIEAPGEIPVHRQELHEKMQSKGLLLTVG